MYLKLLLLSHYTSYSLLNIVHVIVCVFGLTNQVCKYFEFFMQKQIWCLRIYEECLKIWILGKLGLKLVFLKNFASHTHTFYSYFSMLGGVYAQNLAVFQNCVFFRISIDRGCFSINRNCFKIFRGASVCFDQSKLIFDQLKIVWEVFIKTDFQLSQTL